MRIEGADKLQLKMYSKSLAVLAALSLASCGSDGAEEARERALAAKEKAASEARELADRGEQLGDEAVEAGKEALDQGKEISQSLLLRGKSLSKWSTEEMHDYAVEMREKYGDDLNAAGAHVNELLDKIARDPNEKFTTAYKAGHMIVLMIPIVGPTKRYADARKLYEIGRAEQDEARMQEARREVLIACAEAGLDIGTLGLVGAHVDLVATGADKALKMLKLSRNANVLLGKDLKTFDHLLDQLLEQEDIRLGVDNALMLNFSMVVQSD